MNTKIKISQEDTLKANVYVHAFLANSGEYNKSPHFKPENKEKVRKILLRLTEGFNNTESKVIDFGCGTGFMIDLMSDLFKEVHGVDITLDMMRQVDLSSGNIYLHESRAENTDFESNSFDFATAYSFMDHLFDYKTFLLEAFRVLKDDGIFYSDLNPNRDFIVAIGNAESTEAKYVSNSSIVEREIGGALHNGEYYKNAFGMDSQLLENAEPIKTVDKGFNANEVLKAAYDIGFSKCYVEYEWFLGQAKVMHEHSLNESEIIEQYLNTVLPVSSSLFKYLRFIFIK